MASFEEIGLVFQIIQNIYGLVRNMRDNAAGYKAQVLAGKPIAQIAAVMVEDADQYLRRGQWITDLAARNLALFDNCLARLGLTRADAVALRDTVNIVANHTKAATLSNGTQINAEADFTLANIPNFERLF